MKLIGKKTKILGQPVRFKFFISYYLILCVPVILVSFITYYVLKDNMVDKLKETYTDKLNKIEMVVNYEFSQLDRMAVQFSAMPWIKYLYEDNHSALDFNSVDPVSLNSYMRELVTQKSVNKLIDILAVNIKGKEYIISDNEVRSLYPFFEEGFYIESINLNDWRQIINRSGNERAFMSEYVYNHGNKLSGIVFIKTIPSSEKDMYGTLIVLVNELRLKEKINNTINDDTLSICIYNDNNDILLSINANIEFYKNLGKDDILAQGSGSRNIAIDAQEKMLFYIKSEDRDWTYLITVPQSAILKEIEKLTFVMRIITLIILILGIPVTFTMATRNYKPISRIIGLGTNKSLINQQNQRINEYDILNNILSDLLNKNNTNEQQLSYYKPLLTNGYLMKILNGEVSADPLMESTLTFLGVDFAHNNILCCYFEFEHDSSVEFINDYSSKNTFKYKYDYFIVNYNAKQKALIICFESMTQMHEIVFVLKQLIEQESGELINLGVGNVYHEVDMLSKSYFEAKESLKQWIIQEKGKIIYYSSLKSEDEIFHYPLESSVWVYNALKSGNHKECIAAFDRLIERNTHNSRISLSTITLLVSTIFTSISKVADEIGLSEEETAKVKELLKISDINQLRLCTINLFTNICDKVVEIKENKKDSLKSNIINWLSENYSDNSMSLIMAADNFDVADTFISRIVKEECGLSFVEFINKKRIEEAKKLLKEEELSINQIAGRVGYNNDITFRRIFKKYEGITPGEFRDNF